MLLDAFADVTLLRHDAPLEGGIAARRAALSAPMERGRYQLWATFGVPVRATCEPFRRPSRPIMQSGPTGPLAAPEVEHVGGAPRG